MLISFRTGAYNIPPIQGDIPVSPICRNVICGIAACGMGAAFYYGDYTALMAKIMIIIIRAIIHFRSSHGGFRHPRHRHAAYQRQRADGQT